MELRAALVVVVLPELPAHAKLSVENASFADSAGELVRTKVGLILQRGTDRLRG
jgi:hypothetical protein